MSFKSEIAKMLSNARTQCESYVPAAELLQNIEEITNRLNEPLRVAVVGIMKAGKSTLMNSLLKEKILFTGKVTTTYTVTWFKYGDTPELEVVFRDGRSKRASVDELEKWTTWNAVKKNSDINNVQHVIIYYPNEILKQIELIDTPGINSIGKTDSDNTEQAIIGQAEKDTIKHVSLADAVLYTFVRTAGSVDRDFLERFQGNAFTLKTTPINGLGILSQSDILWNIFSESDISAIEAGKVVTDELRKNPTINRLVYDILPTSCLMEEGAVSMTDEDWNLIYSMSNIDNDDFIGLIFNTSTFIYKDQTKKERKEQQDFPEKVREYIGTSVQRERLIQMLSQYGLYEFVKYARQGKTKEEIVELSYELSGIKTVFKMLETHFGGKAFLIKVDTMLKYFKRELNFTKQNTQDDVLTNICDNILSDIDDIETTSLGFKELSALQDYYNGKITFSISEEEEDFKQIVGEYGKSCEAKLGVNDALTTSELKTIAYEKVKYWTAKTAAFDITEKERRVAKIIERSYSVLYNHLNEISEF